MSDQTKSPFKGVKTLSGTFITNRMEDAAETLEGSVVWDSKEPMSYEERLAVPLARHLRAVADAWLGSETDWRQLRPAWPILQVCDVILDDEISKADDL